MKNNTNWILKGARVIDPINNVDTVRDIYVRDGRIAAAEDMEGVDTLRADYLESRWAYPDEDA
jgi:predicted amidohydrolase